MSMEIQRENGRTNFSKNGINVVKDELLNSDYAKELFEKSINFAVQKIFLIVIGLGGGIIPFFLLFFNKEYREQVNNIYKDGFYFLAAITLIFLMLIFFNFLHDLINLLFKERAAEKEKLKSLAVLPNYITLGDIQPYVIEETSVKRKFTFNEKSVSFDVENKIYYKVRGGNQQVEYIEHTYKNKGNKYNSEIFKNMSINLEETEYKDKRLELSCNRNDTHHVIKVVFANKLLLPNEVIEYCIIMKYSNYQFISKEELDFYKLCEPDSGIEGVFYSRKFGLGVSRMNISLDFPVGYPIIQPGFRVTYQSNKSVNLEIDRLKSEDSFEYYDNTSTNKLKLSVEKPIVNLNYILYWNPPTLKTLSYRKFLNKKQCEIISKRIKKDEEN
ncbi:MAG: hypothetical protein QG588_22 [Candidatus Poribacteria bacterium]|nr:hypothetical protein [Candidatus Poribacteria bacterium]